MDDNILLSVIVPVYNAESTLRKSVGSLFRQGMPSGSFEVLLVNDGSKDNSLECCKRLAMEHAEIKVIDKENGGVASARNRGLEEAIGEWVAFLDADDYLIDDGYKTAFVPYVNRKNVHLIHYYSDYDFWPVRELESGVKHEGSAWDLMRMRKEALPSFCWLYFYRKSFLCKKAIKFQRYIVGEDQLFSSQVYLANPYMLTVNATIYRYTINTNSATTSRNINHCRQAVCDYINSYSDILAFIDEQGINDDVMLFDACKTTIDSKKAFAVSRMLSARYSYKEWKRIKRLCRNTHFYPIGLYGDSISNQISISLMNCIMRYYIVYYFFSFCFISIIEPFILPRIRKSAKC